MSSRAEQYDYSGTKSSWRKWKRFLKKQTARKNRRIYKKVTNEVPTKKTQGWVS